MENDRLTVEATLGSAIQNLMNELENKAKDSVWWCCVWVVSIPFLLFFFALLAIPMGVRLAVANADRVIFVLASSLLSFYQIPRKIFYIYISVLAVTGFLQFLTFQSYIRVAILYFLAKITRGTSDLFLRKYTSLHFSNPFNRRHTESKVVFVPIGLTFYWYPTIEVFDFPTLTESNFNKVVGDCKIKIKTLLGSTTARYLRVYAPWGAHEATFDMLDDNLGRLISYLNHMVTTNCSELICSGNSFGYDFRALTILETINHFNSGVKLVKLSRNDDPHIIV